MRRLPLFLAVLALLLTACTSTKVTSNLDPSYDNTLDGLVLIVTRFTDDRARFEATFKEDVATKLWARGAQARFMAQAAKRLELEADSTTATPYAHARSLDAMAILVITEEGYDESWNGTAPVMGPTGVWTGGASLDQQYRLDASLYDVASERRVWRAEVVTKGDMYTSKSAEAKSMTKKLIEQLAEDGLLGPSVAEPRTRPTTADADE
jgi:hypothetical protein